MEKGIKIQSKFKRFSDDIVLSVDVIVFLGEKLIIKAETSRRMTIANGFKIDTNAAYRHVPEKDFSKVIRDVQSPFTDTVIQEFCEELQKVFPELTQEVLVFLENQDNHEVENDAK